MQLEKYVSQLQQQLHDSAAAGGEDARALAERLTAPLDASLRLVILAALSDAASQITAEIAPGSVDVRLRGLEPEFVVELPDRGAPQPGEDHGNVVSGDVTDFADDVTSRTTLRLPEQLKTQVEAAAAKAGLSVNTWMVRTIAAAVDSRKGTPVRDQATWERSVTGWVR